MEIEMSKKAMEQALEALEYHREQTRAIPKSDAAIAALKEAITQQDNGPEFEDGCSLEGFVGGCERMGCHASTVEAIKQQGESDSNAEVEMLRAAMASYAFGESLSNVGLGGTIWGYGEDIDGWYVCPPGEKIGYAISESDAKRIAACVNACIGIPINVLNTNGVSPNPNNPEQQGNAGNALTDGLPYGD
jgi:hypothetical protein